MSGPLAQQFAQVRKDIAGCCEGVACDPGKCDRDLTLAALSVIERHVQDMETAIAWACGEGDSDFYSEHERKKRGLPIYWWRSELRNRASHRCKRFPPC